MSEWALEVVLGVVSEVLGGVAVLQRASPWSWCGGDRWGTGPGRATLAGVPSGKSGIVSVRRWARQKWPLLPVGIGV